MTNLPHGLKRRFATGAGPDVTNHPDFGGPTPSTGLGLGLDATYPSSNFGRITSANDPRILQGAFKFIF